jgi:hypothetical protein
MLPPTPCRFDEGLAARTRVLLDRLMAPGVAASIRAASDGGLRMLAELHVEEVRLCEQHGNTRLEEGWGHSLEHAPPHLNGTHSFL